MSDILLVGLKPASEEGKEYFLHCADYWVDILEVIYALTDDSFPVENYMYRDSWLALPTPHLNGHGASMLSLEIEKIIEDGSARSHLEQYYRKDPLSTDYFAGDEEHLVYTLNERLQQLDELVLFLRSSGGCRASWSYESPERSA